MPDLKNFEQLGLSQVTLDALAKKGFEKPTEIQEQCIPLLLQEKADVIGQAQTGTGKTAAFGLPILEVIDPYSNATQAIILEPTRELAIQVAEEISSFTGSRRVEVAAIYGGASMDLQLRKLRRGVQIVVGTPGRIMDHLRRGSLKLGKLQVAVLDEADEMLDMGFIDDIDNILSQTPSEKRMLCFSATMPAQIMKLTSKFMTDPTVIRIKGRDMTSNLTEQLYFELRENEKFEALCRIIDMELSFYSIIFCKTKIQCDELGRKLQEKGYSAEPLHGDLSQKQREQILNKMKRHIIKIIVATDVAARGIDINDLTHVINYSIPQAPEAYIHRIGRTGRAGKKGTAITFVTRNETRKLSYIERIAKTEIKRGQIPSTKDIIAIKKNRIETQLKELIENPVENNQFSNIASQLLEEKSGEEIISALLAHFYKNELDESKYRSIAPSSRRGDERNRDRISYHQDDGNVRLFIARGRKDGLGPRELVDYLKGNIGADDSDIQNVTVRDEFSFVSAPVEVAEKIIETINATTNGGAPIVSRAKPDNPNGKRLSRGYRDHDRGGYRDRDRDRGGERDHNRDRDRGGDRFRSPRPFGDRRRFDKPKTSRSRDDSYQPYGSDSRGDSRSDSRKEPRGESFSDDSRFSSDSKKKKHYGSKKKR